MLILSRRIGESIIIDDNIKVTVLGIDRRGLGIDRRGQVKLGFEAPEEVVIVRKELLGKDGSE